MDQLLLIIASVALVGLTVLWILRPLLGGAEASRERSREERDLAELALQHEASLKSLRDLDTDFMAGKLDAADYQTQRGVLLAEGVAILQRIDSLRARLTASDPDLDKRIEEAVKARRAVPEPAAVKPVCPACGAAVRVGARFCDQCGAALTVVTATPVPGGKGS
ncbi:MAG: zinc ribbon domain-containing protein [Anaerolineae bacterium]|nr:zinc ribbon domain-containing protein [Anaerolineae bacterium]